MKTIEEMIKEYKADDPSIVFDRDDVEQIAKKYAKQFINMAILKCEICCNNFYPTLSGAELLKIKQLI